MSRKVPFRALSALMITFIILGSCGGAVAQQANTACGPPPPPDVTKEISDVKKADLQGKAQALSKYLGSGELAGKIDSERKTIYQTTDESEAIREDRYLAYMACIVIMGDKTASFKEKMDAIQTLRKPRTEYRQPDQKAIYTEGMRRDDLRAVEWYLTHGRVYEYVDGEGNVRERRATREIYVDNKTVRITNVTDSRCIKCIGAGQLDHSVRSIEECSANISDLDELISVGDPCSEYERPGFPETLTISCLSGNCWTCKSQRTIGKATTSREDVVREENSRARFYWVWLRNLSTSRMTQQSTRLNSLNRSLDQYLDQYATSLRPQFCSTLGGLARALSRIVAYGSDEKFCGKHPSYCEQ
jgi:hypothetical protein